MLGAIFDLLFNIARLILLIVFSYKFATSDMNEIKTLCYGMWVLMCMQ